MEALSNIIGEHLMENRNEHFQYMTQIMKEANKQDDDYVARTKSLLDSVNSCNALIDRLKREIKNEKNEEEKGIKRQRMEKVERKLENYSISSTMMIMIFDYMMNLVCLYKYIFHFNLILHLIHSIKIKPFPWNTY